MFEEFFVKIQDAIVDLDEDLLAELTNQIENKNIDPVEAVEKGYTVGIKKVGDLFQQGEIFLPELILAGEMVKGAISSLEQEIPLGKIQKKGKCLMGTVEGDIHDIGKDLVCTMLSSQGIEVIDIGVDCSPGKFIDSAIENDVDIIGASCLLTMTAPELKRLVDELSRRGLRDRFKVIVGGAAVSKDYAAQIGADGYGADLKEAVDVALSLMDKQ